MKNYKITLLYTDIESLQLRKINITVKADNTQILSIPRLFPNAESIRSKIATPKAVKINTKNCFIIPPTFKPIQTYTEYQAPIFSPHPLLCA